MCKVIKTYGCGHSEEIEEPCMAMKRLIRHQPKQTWLHKLFGIKVVKPRCRSPPGISQTSRPCQECEGRQKHYEIIAQNKRLAAKKQRQEVQRNSSQKLVFICSSCKREGRRSAIGERHANGGLCCARGIEEWELQFGAIIAGENSGYAPAPSSFTISRERVWGQIPRAHSPPQQTRRLDTRASRNASKATHPHAGEQDITEQYTQDRNRVISAHIEPDLVRSFINNPDLLHLPQPQSRPQPRYQDAGIDTNIWDNQMVQGPHGRLPAPPERPLPAPPLRINKFKQGTSTQGQQPGASAAARSNSDRQTSMQPLTASLPRRSATTAQPQHSIPRKSLNQTSAQLQERSQAQHPIRRRKLSVGVHPPRPTITQTEPIGGSSHWSRQPTPPPRNSSRVRSPSPVSIRNSRWDLHLAPQPQPQQDLRSVASRLDKQCDDAERGWNEAANFI